MTKEAEVIEGQDVLTGKEIATIGGGAKQVMVGGMKYAVTNQVNLPTLKQESGETVAIRITDPIREEVQYKDIMVNDPNNPGQKVVQKQENIINVGRVMELSSNQMFEYVYNAMTADNIRNAYPNEAYVGKCFGIQKLGVVQGKQYKQTNVVEIEPVEA